MTRQPNSGLRAGLTASLVLMAAITACAPINVTIQPPVTASAAPANPGTPAVQASAAVTTPATTPAAEIVSTPKTAEDLTPEEDLDPEEGDPVDLEDYYEDDGLDFRVFDYHAEGGYDEDEDGDIDEEGTFKVTLDEDEDGEYEEAPHEMEFDEEDEEVQSDDPDQLVITDKTEQETRTFAMDDDSSKLEMRAAAPIAAFGLLDVDAKVEMVINPDGTISVNGQTAADAKAAGRLLADNPLVKDTSRHTLAALIGRLQNEKAEESRDKPVVTGQAEGAVDKIGGVLLGIGMNAIVFCFGFLG